MCEPIHIPQVSPWLGEEEAAAAAKAVASGWVTEGPSCEAFSTRLRELIDVPYGVFAPNGTLALALALMALGVGEGDEVLIPDITFIGSANAVILVGGTPIFVDVEPDTFQIDLGLAECLVTSRTRAIMPVHLYGTACDMTAVQAFAARHGIRVIEDAAQGIAVYNRNRHVGGLGDIGCFSFFADKTVTTGEGGYVVCRDSMLYDRLRFLRNQGRLNSGTFKHPMIGYNFRITDIQGAIGLVQLAKLGEIIGRKGEIYSWYREELAGLAQVRILGRQPESTHVPFRCVLMASRAHELMAFLGARGVQSRGFFYPMHRQPCFIARFENTPFAPSLKDGDYPNAMFGFENGVCLPIFPTLRRDQVSYIAQQIIAFYS